MSLCHLSSTGFEKSVVLPTVYWGLLASGGVRLHCSHAALPARFHHDLRRSPQVSEARCQDHFF